MSEARNVDIEDRDTVYDGYLTVERLRLRHDLFAGGMSRPLLREVIDRGATAAVLPYDPARETVLLIEQFRPGAWAGGGDPWLWEIVAGVVEAGETPEDVVRREAQEEAGIAVGPLTPVAAIFLTPGICSERCHIFAAPCDLAGAGGLHGHPDEGEDIRARAFSFDEAERLVREGGISNAITQVALQWLALNRQDLTQPAGKRT
jgi:ADP-ribose pyrophosphatase